MNKILSYIAQETGGKRFDSFRYCYDTQPSPNVAYEPGEESYINMKEYAESDHNSKVRNMSVLAESCALGPALFKYFLDGSRRVYSGRYAIRQESIPYCKRTGFSGLLHTQK